MQAMRPGKSGRSRLGADPHREQELAISNAMAPADGTHAARCDDRDFGTSRVKGRLEQEATSIGRGRGG
jgi:hypothetical protein